MIFVVPALFATPAQMRILIHTTKRLIFVHFTKAYCMMEKTEAFGTKHKRRMPNDRNAEVPLLRGGNDDGKIR
nr:MAG TPA: hypothetical protein [Caudoviricetes sp.]